MDAPTARLPRLTIGLLMRLVAYCAVGMGIVVPMFRINGASGDSMVFPLILSVVAVPLAWSGLSLVLFPRGASRDRYVVGFLLASVVATLLIFIGIPAVTLWELGPSIFEGMAIESLAFGLVFFALMTIAAGFLGRRLIRRLEG